MTDNEDYLAAWLETIEESVVFRCSDVKYGWQPKKITTVEDKKKKHGLLYPSAVISVPNKKYI